VAANAGRILERAEAAAQLGAAVVVFPLHALSGVGPAEAAGLGPGEAKRLARQTEAALARLALEADRRALGGRYLLVGTRGWLEAGAPQLQTALLHQAKVGLKYTAGRPDPLGAPWRGEHRVDGELAAPEGAELAGRGPAAVFRARGCRFGLEVAGAGVGPGWRLAGARPPDAVLRQLEGGALVADHTGLRLSPDQPDHEGLSLWRAAGAA
jgi:hypothetical protein